jgi:hypothetical protein
VYWLELRGIIVESQTSEKFVLFIHGMLNCELKVLVEIPTNVCAVPAGIAPLSIPATLFDRTVVFVLILLNALKAESPVPEFWNTPVKTLVMPLSGIWALAATAARRIDAMSIFIFIILFQTALHRPGIAGRW